MSSLGFHCSFSLSPHHSPDVEFCGYCITHPSESKINFRIQTRGMDVHVLFVSGLFLWDSVCLCQVSAMGCTNKEKHFSLSSLLAICIFCALLLHWAALSFVL